MLAVCLSGAAATGVVVWSDTLVTHVSLLAALAAVIVSPVAVRIAQRRFDLFEPIVPLSAGLLVLFVARPAAQLAYGDLYYQGRSIELHFDETLLLVLIGVIALYAGYAVDAGRSLARRIRTTKVTWDHDRAVRIGFVLVALGLALFAVFLSGSGGVDALRRLLAGRSSGDGALYAGHSAYLYYGPFLAIPAALIFLDAAAVRRRSGLYVAALLAAGVVAVITAPRGDRIWLLSSLGSVALVPYLRTGRRPRPWSVAGVIAVAFFIGVAFLGQIRTPEQRTASPTAVLERTVKEPGEVTREFMLGPDTEMFPVLALLVAEVPDKKPYSHGITVGSLVAHPVPRRIWPAKPHSADREINEVLFPARAARSRAGAAPSMFGGFYYDWGLAAVLLGAFVVGVLWRWLFEVFRRLSHEPGVRLLYAAALPLTIVLLRGNPTDTAARAAYVVGPVVAVMWYLSRRAGAARRRAAWRG